jgi:8-oxo-dGTP diphosphatase
LSSGSAADPEPIEIAVALIRRKGCYLLTRRPDHIHLGGYWEFPGGKFRPGEAPDACAAREALEEVGVQCEAVELLPPIVHRYPDRTVRLHPVLCEYRGGPPRPLEVAEWSWVTPADFGQYKFPEANASLLALLRAAGQLEATGAAAE